MTRVKLRTLLLIINLGIKSTVSDINECHRYDLLQRSLPTDKIVDKERKLITKNNEKELHYFCTDITSTILLLYIEVVVFFQGIRCF